MTLPQFDEVEKRLTKAGFAPKKKADNRDEVLKVFDKLAKAD
jgi:hypothetical protein